MKRLLCRKYPSIKQSVIKANHIYNTRYIRSDEIVPLAPMNVVEEEINNVIDTINYWLEYYDYSTQDFAISNVELYNQSEDEDEEWYSFDLTDSDGITIEGTGGVYYEGGWIPYSEVQDTSDSNREIANAYFQAKGIAEKV